MKYLILFFNFILINAFSQVVDIEAKPIGGISNVEHIFETQCIYPKNLLDNNINHDVAIYFDVLKNGTVTNIVFKNEYPIELKNESIRILKFILFEPATIGSVKVDSQSFLVFKFNTASYKKYCKKRGFQIHKNTPLFDTSFVIYERADTSPEYYKGEEAFKNYILSNLEYPDIAIRQGLQGTVIVSFIVEPNGTLSNLKVEKEFNHLCTNEAFKVLINTKWTAAKKDGKLIRYKTKYPIVFSLNNINKDFSASEQK